MVDKERQASADVEVTDSMIEMGVEELRSHYLGMPLSELAEAVYRRMELERRAQSGSV